MKPLNTYGAARPDAGAAPQLKGGAKDAQRQAEHGRDNAMHGAKPKVTAGPNPGIRQIDGNQSALGNKPTKASLQDRPASGGVGSGSTSGMEGALGALADKLHPRKFNGRRGG